MSKLAKIQPLLGAWMWRLGAVAGDAVGKRDVAVPATKQDFDPAFGEALLREGIETMLVGDINTGKAILRDYIKATVGFEKLGEATHTPPKSLIRMFGPRGNPQARNLFGIIGYLQQQAGVELHVMAEPR